MTSGGEREGGSREERDETEEKFAAAPVMAEEYHTRVAMHSKHIPTPNRCPHMK